MARFKTSRMYAFRYNPKLKDKLPFYDRTPLMFPLNPGPSHTLGLNIHWIPQRHRKKFIEWILERSLDVKNKKKFARLVYNTIKGNAALRPALKGIRLYINHRATQVTEISRDEVGSFFLPRQVQKGFFRRHKSSKVFRKR